MIEITERAQQYFRHLIEQQGGDGLGLRIRVLSPGTPSADCDLQFWPSESKRPGDLSAAFAGFELHIATDSADWLREAEIDFEADATGGQLTIKAPHIKGHEPEQDTSLTDRVRWVLDSEINPRLAAHGGKVSLVEVSENGEVVLQFGGGCHGCGMVSVTLREGIEKTLREHFPEVTGICDATDHDRGENPYYHR